MSADGPSGVSEPVAHKPPGSIYHDSRQHEGSHPPRWPLWVISGHLQCKKACPLSANNGYDDESARFPWIGGACKPDFACP